MRRSITTTACRVRLGSLSWLVAPALLLSNACILGEDDELDSAYETASIEVADSRGVADGITPVEVAVTGQPGASLTLQVLGEGGSFMAADVGSPAQKTVFLADDGSGVGLARAGVLATRDGVVTVALKADPVRTARELEFSPVRMAVGPAVPVRIAPGKVVHQVCVAVNSAGGRLQAESLTVAGEFAPVSVEVRPSAPAGAACPSEPVDGFGWRGFAGFSWGTAADFAQVVMSYQGPGQETLTTEILDLEGVAFAGYDVVAGAPTSNESWTSIELSLAYPDVAGLAGGPAAGVLLQDLRFIPENGPTFLGSSSGGANDPPVTDWAGRVVLFFDTAGLQGTYALFVTPENGATVYLTDISIVF